MLKSKILKQSLKRRTKKVKLYNNIIMNIKMSDRVDRENTLLYIRKLSLPKSLSYKPLISSQSQTYPIEK